MTATSKIPNAHFLLLCLALLLTSRALELDIHLSLRTTANRTDLCPFDMALESNLALREESRSETIDFFAEHTPHISLYLTDFDVESNGKLNDDKLQEIVRVATRAVSNHSSCIVSWPKVHPRIRGAYAMYPIPRSHCLQELSDSLAMALETYIHRPPKVPSWIYLLSPWERWWKLRLIRKYGSPNVFDGFEPHVTVGYNKETSSKKRYWALDKLHPPTICQGQLSMVSIGRVGVGGSVLQDGVIAEIPLVYQEPQIDTDVETKE